MFTGLSHQIRYVRQYWAQSKVFRRILIIVSVYLLLRLTLQGVVVAMVLAAGPQASETTLVANDLKIYLEAASRLQHQQDLYLQTALDKVAVYQYAPSFTLLLTPLLGVSFGILVLGHTLLNIGCYILLYLWWGRIFHRLGLTGTNQMLAWTLPVWLIFAAFWGDLGYLNIYFITALCCTLLIEAVLEERLGWSLLWVSLLLQTKPYLAFPLAVPLLLGRPRFFFKLLGLAVVGYGAVTGLTILMMGPAYGWEQHDEYFRFLAEMRHNFPWRGPEQGFLGYNHSITQITVFLLGVTPTALRLATGIKLLLLVPLALVSLRHLLRPAGCAGSNAPHLSLDLAFALYTGAFIWLDIVWELSLGIVVFTYLLATLAGRSAKIWVWALFLPYALLDFWQVASLILFGPEVFASDRVWTDPSVYLPMVMLVILTFYILLIQRLWSIPVQTADSLSVPSAEPFNPVTG